MLLRIDDLKLMKLRCIRF